MGQRGTCPQFLLPSPNFQIQKLAEKNFPAILNANISTLTPIFIFVSGIQYCSTRTWVHSVFSFAQVITKPERVALMISVANSPGLTRSLRVSGFDLRAPGVALQSTVYGANCSCVKKILTDHSDVISEVPKCSKFSRAPMRELYSAHPLADEEDVRCPSARILPLLSARLFKGLRV